MPEDRSDDQDIQNKEVDEGENPDLYALDPKAVQEPPQGLEVVTLRLQAFLPAPELPLQAVGVTSGDSDSRPAYFGSDVGWHDVAVVSRSQLSVEPSIGPFIVEDYDATTLVPPGIWARLDEWGNVVIDLKS